MTNEIESIQKTKELVQVLKSLGVEDDINRVKNSIKKRSGKSKRRGRSNRIGKSAIIIVGSPNSSLLKLNDSIPGINIKFLKDLSVLDFAPGCKPTRLTIFTNEAINKLNEIKIPSNILSNK